MAEHSFDFVGWEASGERLSGRAWTSKRPIGSLVVTEHFIVADGRITRIRHSMTRRRRGRPDSYEAMASPTNTIDGANAGGRRAR